MLIKGRRRGRNIHRSGTLVKLMYSKLEKEKLYNYIKYINFKGRIGMGRQGEEGKGGREEGEE